MTVVMIPLCPVRFRESNKVTKVDQETVLAGFFTKVTREVFKITRTCWTKGEDLAKITKLL